MAGIEGNYTRETVLIDSESARLIPHDMTGRVRREAEVRKLMLLLAPAEERG